MSNNDLVQECVDLVKKNSRFKVLEGGSRVCSGSLLEAAVHSFCCIIIPCSRDTASSSPKALMPPQLFPVGRFNWKVHFIV